MAELCERRVRVVQREAGASSQKAFVAAVVAHGGLGCRARCPPGICRVARQVADGAAAGVTMEPAALSRDLAFEALEEHVVEVWIDERWREHPGADALIGLLRLQTFKTRLVLGGWI